MDISGAIALAGETIKLVKGLKDIDHDLDKDELKGNMATLYSDLADVKMALVDAQTALRDREDQIEKLKGDLAFSGSLIDVKGFKFEVDGTGQPYGTPFCPVCEQKSSAFVRVTPAPRNSGDRGSYSCPSCKSRFGYPVPIFAWPEGSSD